MNNSEFKLLPANKQASFVCKNGTFLIEREWKEIRFMLFSLDDLFVEFFYDSANKDLIGARSFRSRKCLQPYLDEIELDF